MSYLNDFEFRNIKSANEKAKSVAQQVGPCSVTILWNAKGMEKIITNTEFPVTQEKSVDAEKKAG